MESGCCEFDHAVTHLSNDVVQVRLHDKVGGGEIGISGPDLLDEGSQCLRKEPGAHLCDIEAPAGASYADRGENAWSGDRCVGGFTSGGGSGVTTMKDPFAPDHTRQCQPRGAYAPGQY